MLVKCGLRSSYHLKSSDMRNVTWGRFTCINPLNRKKLECKRRWMIPKNIRNSRNCNALVKEAIMKKGCHGVPDRNDKYTFGVIAHNQHLTFLVSGRIK